MKAPQITRRGLVVSVAGIGAGGAIAAGWLALQDVRTLILHIIKLDLPGVSVSAETLDAFSAHMLSQKKMRENVVYRIAARGLSGAVGLVDFRSLQRVGPGREALETFRRAVITEFLVTTDYLYLVEPRTEPVSFLGEQICGNPFARFD